VIRPKSLELSIKLNADNASRRSTSRLSEVPSERMTSLPL
jgi:hypothetical protein